MLYEHLIVVNVIEAFEFEIRHHSIETMNCNRETMNAILLIYYEIIDFLIEVCHFR